MIRLLEKREVDPGIIRIIRELNSDNNTYIKTDKKLTAQISVARGMRQDNSLSSILFNLIMDEIIREVKTAGKEYRMEDKQIKVIRG